MANKNGDMHRFCYIKTNNLLDFLFYDVILLSLNKEGFQLGAYGDQRTITG
jgi:hypothetical protein